MTHEEAVKRANEVREGIEKDVDDLAAHFTGGIYGEDETAPPQRMGSSDKTGQTENVIFADENEVNIQALRISPRRKGAQMYASRLSLGPEAGKEPRGRQGSSDSSWHDTSAFKC